MSATGDVNSANVGASSGGQRAAPLDIQIVPLKGLPIAAAALVLVIFSIASNSTWALMLTHVAGG